MVLLKGKNCFDQTPKHRSIFMCELSNLLVLAYTDYKQVFDSADGK